MSLDYIKTQYQNGIISLLEYTHKAKKFKEELDLLYPQNMSISGKAYLYLHNLDVNIGWCDIGSKERKLISMAKGYRKFCGNMSVCQCNKNAKHEFWATADHAKISEKRKKTVNKLYGVDSVSQLEENKIKAAQTCFKKYGTKSPTQNPDILKKSSLTCMKNYGVNWPQQNQHVLSKTTDSFLTKYGVTRPAKNSTIKEVTKITCLKRYNTENPLQSHEIHNKGKETRKRKSFDFLIKTRKNVTPLFDKQEYAKANSSDLLAWECNKCKTFFYQTFRDTNDKSCPECFPKTLTWGEAVIKNWLDDWGIQYMLNTYKVIKPYQLDFYIPSLKLAIEFNGLYWHSELAGRGKNYHKNKFIHCLEQDISLIQIFEQDLYFQEDIIKSRLMTKLKIQQHTMFARKLKVSSISHIQARDFFKENHLQGSINSSINYGLVDETGKLYAAMSFSKTRFSKKYQYELTRFAIKQKFSVPGAASKLFHAFIKKHSPDSVVTYSDLNWGKGEFYESLGFCFSHYSTPNYWYFKNLDEIHSRIKFQKHKLPKELHHLGSEWDIMKHLKFNRYWDTGNAVYIWKK